MPRSRGGTGGPDPLKNNKNIGFISKTVPKPLKNHKVTKPGHSVLGHPRQASETPFKFRWQANDDPLIVVLGSSYQLNLKKSKLDPL